MKEYLLTQREIRRLFNYNPDTGEFIRTISTSSQARAGDIAGCKNKKGYTVTHIGGKLYGNHRLAWLYAYGYFPEHFIDHINRDRSDNRLCNLREVTNQCNIRNSGKFSNNSSGVRGVCWNKQRNKWESTIMIDLKNTYLGCYECFSEAVAYRLAAEQCSGWSECESESSAYRHIRGLCNVG